MLAWATTVHKSQGGTIDYLVADVSSSFVCGHHYVALSRAKTEAGLQIVGFVPSRVKTSPDALAFHDAMEHGDEFFQEFLRTGPLWFHAIVKRGPAWTNLFRGPDLRDDAHAAKHPGGMPPEHPLLHKTFRSWMETYPLDGKATPAVPAQTILPFAS